jgi:ABC-type Fe3+/spermidine/putrescine transport system ATPase subunit
MNGHALGSSRATPLGSGSMSREGVPAVEVRDLTKEFGAAPALDNVSLAIQPGEFFSLLGPSGCGKTTLMRIIGGFESPSSGEVRIGGRVITHEPPYRRSTNMIFQHFALFPHLSVAKNIAFGLEVKSVRPNIIEQKVKEALSLVRMEEYGERSIETLSGGQKQRVAIARALVNEPEVLLLDEPLGALDLQLRLQMQAELRRLHRATGNTFVFVTHDQGEAITLSDRIAVMKGGRVLQVGTPKEIYESPQTRFVAEFMGHANFLTGRLTSTVNGRCAVEVNNVQIECRANPGVVPGNDATVMLRYEKLHVSVREGGPVNAFDGILTSKLYMGASVRLGLELADGLALFADLPSTNSSSGLSVGAPVRAHWVNDDAIVLND